MNIFDIILVKPLINLLVFFYSVLPVHDFGLAIILVTVVIRAVLWPLQGQTLRSQKALNKLQPEIKKISDKYKNDPKKVQALTLELYKEKEVNPLSSCLPSLIQLPLLFALFYALIKFRDPAFLKLANPNSGLPGYLYMWVKDLSFVKGALVGTFHTTLLGLVDLSKANVVLALLAGGTQYLQTKLMMPVKTPDAGGAAQTMNFMLYMFPVLTIVIGFTLPSALPLYWAVTSGAAALQQYLVMHHDVDELDEKVSTKVITEGKIEKVPGKTKK
jgi:YidC/Oxa1 family membrane protein insertase